MLKKEFNKFSGTEIRVQRQVPFFLQLFNWIKSVQENNNSLNLDEWNKEYIEWTKNEEIYKYKSSSIKNRFGMIRSILSKFGIIYDQGFFNINININEKELFQSLQNYKNNSGVRPFFELLNFAYKKDKLNPKKLIYSFMVFNGEESFEDLYQKDILEELLIGHDSNELPKFRKPPYVIDFIKLIYIRKKENKELFLDDFKHYNHSKDQYIKKIVFLKNEKFNLKEFISKINNISLKDYVVGIRKSQLLNLIEKDYFDLFSRWLFDFGLIDVSGKKVKKFNSHYLFKLKNGNYDVKKETGDYRYPYTFEFVSEVVLEMSKDKFAFKYLRPELAKIGNSIISEYFINLYYAYKLNLSPKEFKNFANTKMDEKLLPIYTAPGGKADMEVVFKNGIINIESTLLKNKKTIQKNEIFPCINHFHPSDEIAKNSYLIFISRLNTNEYAKYFNVNFKLDHPDSELILSTFENIIVPNI